MRWRRALFLTLILLLSVTTLESCQQSNEANSKKDDKKVIKVALSAEINPPYLYTNKDNEFIGLDMDYMKKLEQKLPQYQFEYELGEEESNLVGLGAQKFDMAINWFF
ncbi:ABC-type amino acid transport substrate-binding protein [Staphylococcus auricularis]